MKNLLKTLRMAAVAIGITSIFLLGPSSGLLAQLRLTEAQVAALQPASPELVPAFGNFYSATFPDNPPFPYDPFPALPVYRLPDGSWLVDDSSVAFPPPGQAVNALARSFVAENRLAAQQN